MACKLTIPTWENSALSNNRIMAPLEVAPVNNTISPVRRVGANSSNLTVSTLGGGLIPSLKQSTLYYNTPMNDESLYIKNILM